MPGPFFGIECVPILQVHCVEESIAFYSGLGFSDAYAEETFGTIGLGGACLQFEKSPGDAPIPRQTVLIRIDGIAHFYNHARESNAKIALELVYGENRSAAFAVLDPDHHLIKFVGIDRSTEVSKPVADGLEIKVRKLTLAEHQMLTEAVGWGQIIYRPNVPEQISRLEVTVVAFWQGKLVGAASMAGDGKFIHVIGDVMVLPDFQNKGVGQRLMRALEEWLHAHAGTNAFVCLFARSGQVDYYRQFGYQGPEGGLVGLSKVVNPAISH